MAVSKVQFTRALSIIPSDIVPIPSPIIITSGAPSGFTGYQLIDGTKNFYDLGVGPGDVIYNTSSNKAANVVEVLTAASLKIDRDIFIQSTIATGTNTATLPGSLVDSGVDFTMLGVIVGDLVFNTTTNAWAFVTNIPAVDTLELTSDIFTANPQDYSVIQTTNYVLYAKSAKFGTAYDGPCITASGSGQLAVKTVGGDDVTLYMNKGDIIYIQCSMVKETGTSASGIVALW